MKLSHSYIRTSIFGLIFGILLGTIAFTQVFSYPAAGYNGVVKEGSLFTNYFSKMLMSTDINTDGTVIDANNLGTIDSTLYQRRVVGTCPANAPAVTIRPDGSMECRSIYRWVAEESWGACTPNNGLCGGGTRYKGYICKDYRGNTVSDASCTTPSTPKPDRLSQACSANACTCDGTLPGCVYANTCNHNTGNPTILNQPWQQTQTSGTCSYTCLPGHSGQNCDPKPTITQSRTPNPGRVGDTVINTWSTTNATRVYGTCWGQIEWSGPLPPNQTLTQEYDGDQWIGTTYCDWIAYGPGGQSDTHHEVINVSAATAPEPEYCAPRPSYPQATFVDGTPYAQNQQWIKGAGSCGFYCNNGYDGDQCQIPPIGYSYTWQSGAFGSCSVSCTQTRSVVCMRSDGNTVDDVYCTSPKPAISQSCNTGACNGGGGRCEVLYYTLPMGATNDMDILPGTSYTFGANIGFTVIGADLIRAGQKFTCPAEPSCTILHPIGWDNERNGRNLVQCNEYFKAASDTTPMDTTTLEVGGVQTIRARFCPMGGNCHGSLTYTCETTSSGRPVMRTISKTCNPGLEP